MPRRRRSLTETEARTAAKGGGRRRDARGPGGCCLEAVPHPGCAAHSPHRLPRRMPVVASTAVHLRRGRARRRPRAPAPPSSTPPASAPAASAPPPRPRNCRRRRRRRRRRRAGGVGRGFFGLLSLSRRSESRGRPPRGTPFLSPAARTESGQLPTLSRGRQPWKAKEHGIRIAQPSLTSRHRSASQQGGVGLCVCGILCAKGEEGWGGDGEAGH